MAFRISLPLANYLTNTVVDLLAGTQGTSGTANLKIYTGNQPASADLGSSGTLSGTYGTFLCEISGICWTSATSGTAYLASGSGFAGTAVESGTAGWARMECVNAQGTCRVDGDCGTAPGTVFTINSAVLTQDGIATLMSADIYMA